MNLNYVDCPTNHIDFGDIRDMLQVGYCVIMQHLRKFSVWDVSNPLELKKVSEYTPQHLPEMGGMGQIMLVGNSLYITYSELDKSGKNFNLSDTKTYVYKNYKVELNVADPLNIEETSFSEGLLYFEHNGRFFLGWDTGISEYRDGKEIVLFDKSKPGYNDPINDLLAYEDILISAGTNDGVRVFRIKENSLIQLKHVPTQFVMPSALSWDIPGKTFFTIGGFELIFKYDMTVPEKTKRLKGAKTDAIDICSQYVRKGDTLLVFGLKATNGQPHEIPVIYEVDAKVPAIIAKHVLKEYGKKGRIGADRPAGIIQVGDYLLLSTPYRQIGVVKIA